MELIDSNNGIRFMSFKCLKSDMVYTVISTRSVFDNSKPSYLDKALMSEDTLRREDGVKRTLMRNQLSKDYRRANYVYEVDIIIATITRGK